MKKMGFLTAFLGILLGILLTPNPTECPQVPYSDEYRKAEVRQITEYIWEIDCYWEKTVWVIPAAEYQKRQNPEFVI